MKISNRSPTRLRSLLGLGNVFGFQAALWLRNALYAGVLVLAMPWLILRSIRTGRYRQGFCDKFFGLSPSDLPHTPVPNTPAPNTPVSHTPVSHTPDGASAEAATANRQTIWLHGVSVGEILLLRPLVKQLAKKYPRAQICVSTTTQAGRKLAQEVMPEAVHLFFFPLDFSWAVRRTLAALKPSLVLLGELEVWPNFIALCQAREIPVVVVNGRLSQRSFRGYQRVLPLIRRAFGGVSYVAAQTPQYAQHFVGCGVPEDRVSVTGSIKFDNVQFDRQASSVAELRDLVGLTPKQRVVIAGSTQIEEEQIALQAFAKLRHTRPDLRLIIVPRHPERFAAVAQAIGNSGLSWLRRSELTSPVTAQDWSVMLVDTVGELSRWWGVAEVALIGGTFGSRGGQNMIEPAAFGCNVAFGPQTQNFRDAVELLLAAGGASRLQAAEDFLPWLTQQLDDPAAGGLRGENAARLVRQQQGALAATLGVIDSFLQSPGSSPSAASSLVSSLKRETAAHSLCRE